MKQLALILLLVGPGISFAAEPDTAVSDLFKQAQAAVAAGKYDDAVHLYGQVLTEHPTASARWYEAQLAIAQTLAKKGDWAEAAKAAHLCLDGAPTLQTFDAAVTATANILSAQDKNVDRANQFINFEQNGPDPGVTNPMDAVGYPSLPDRETAFAALRKQGDDDDGRLRAMTYLFTGKPRDALAQFADSFRRSSNHLQPTRAGLDLVLIGLRAVRGHRVGLDKAMQFVIYGVNGPDGKPGTPDDLTDPFAEYLSAPPPMGEAGLSQLNPDDLAALKKVRDAAQLYWGDPLLSSEIHRQALGALLKATSALDDWGALGQKDHYLQLALGTPSDELTRALLLHGAELAAKGRELNFGPVQSLWAEIDAKNLPATKGMDEARKQFQTLCDSLNKISFPKLAHKPLTTPAKF